MAGTFERTNLDWQIRQLQQQFGEWLERLLSGGGASTGQDWQLPQWLLETLFWLLVLGFASFLGWQFYQLLRPYLNQRRSGATHATTPPTVADWLQRSRYAQQQANYREACRTLYLAMLQRLNDQNLIAQDSSRTDGEYATLLHTLSKLDRPQPYYLLLHTHERLCFSQTPISAETYDRCWQAYQEIDPI